MPDVREKLVELRSVLGKSVCWGYDDIADIEYIDYEETARNLLANGVTIQRWIPVAERLPENNRPVLVYLKNYTIQGGYVVHIGSYDTAGFWFLSTQPGIASFPVREWVVTHWMPLPDLPKGDD